MDISQVNEFVSAHCKAIVWLVANIAHEQEAVQKRGKNGTGNKMYSGRICTEERGVTHDSHCAEHDI